MRRGLLLDRDGVVNVDRGYVGHREQFTFMPGLFPFLRAAQDYGFRLAILTNQSGVARGMYGVADFENLTSWMCGELQKQGITIDLVLGCFEYPQGEVAAYARESFWRKPNPGMVLDTLRRLRLDPSRSAFLGDQLRDIEAAVAGGIARRLLLNSSAALPSGATRVRDFDEVLQILTKTA